MIPQYFMPSISSPVSGSSTLCRTDEWFNDRTPFSGGRIRTCDLRTSFNISCSSETLAQRSWCRQGAIFTSKLTPALSSYIGKAATSNGIPAASVATFVEVYVAGNSTAIGLFPGSTSTLVTASAHAMKEAYAHAYHYLVSFC